MSWGFISWRNSQGVWGIVVLQRMVILCHLALRQPFRSASSYSSLSCTFWKRVEGNLNKKLGMRSASSYLLADHSAWHITHRQALETYPSHFGREDFLCGIVSAILFIYMFCLLALSIITTGMWNDKQRFTLHWNCRCYYVNRHFKIIHCVFY